MAEPLSPVQQDLLKFWTAAMTHVDTGANPQAALAEAQGKAMQYLGCLGNAGYPGLTGSKLDEARQKCLSETK